MADGASLSSAGSMNAAVKAAALSAVWRSAVGTARGCGSVSAVPGGRNVEVAEGRDPTHAPLGMNRDAQHVEVHALGVGEDDQIDQVLDSAPTSSVWVVGFHRGADLVGDLIDHRVEPIGMSGERSARVEPVGWFHDLHRADRGPGR